MATKEALETPTGDHAPVSNQPEELEDAPGRLDSRPPSEGDDTEATAESAGDVESVPGYEQIQTASEMWTPPTAEELRDIGEASYGPPPPLSETVHGPDDRVRITNTSVYPWRATASLLITAADNSRWIGTGWFIGPRTLMTAGHVVYIKNSGVAGRDGWVKRIDVMPGRNGSTLPYGNVSSSNFRTVSGWTSRGDQNFDYGAIILPTPLGATVGTFGFGVYGDADLRASVVNIAGYPGDKPAGTLWYASRRVAEVGPRKVYYDIDTFGGQSGSAVYRIINGKRYAVAIHAYGGATNNSGTRIVRAVFDNMVAWKI